MYLDLTSLGFNAYLEKGTGTPSWSTALGQGKDHKFTCKGFENILIGIAFCSIPKFSIGCKRGKGARFVDLENDEEIQQIAMFEKVFINGICVEKPFFLMQTKQIGSRFHDGRRAISYSPSLGYYDKSYTNSDFYKAAAAALHIAPSGCWFVYEMEVVNQDELHLYAVVVDPDKPVTYKDSFDRKSSWTCLLP